MQALVIDDEWQVRDLIANILREEGWSVSEAESAERAFEMLPEQRWSLVFCDVALGGENGFAVLRRFQAEQPQAKVILMTGHGSAVGALDATAFGAFDYLLKPFSLDSVRALAASVRAQIVSRGVRSAPASTPVYESDIDLVGASPAFVEVMKLVGRVAPTNLPVLITGESGTGKEIVARAIHRRSPRASHSFVDVNCGALPAELIESELFGHTRGAFTGAERDRAGLWEEADKGTIFLDEITETTPAFQVKLLRALQQGEIRRVGSNRNLQLDVRVIAATNRQVEPEVEAGRFRQDLLYRLNAVTVHLPPLRERRADILPLARRFAERARLPDDAPASFSSEALQLLEAYQWPGNVRELENAVVRATALCDHTVRPEDLPERVRIGATAPEAKDVARADEKAPVAVEEWVSLAGAEGRHVARVLKYTGGNKQAAARLLDVDRKTIDRMIERHKIDLRSLIKSSPDIPAREQE
jgi:two-component system response regulator AtoC